MALDAIQPPAGPAGIRGVVAHSGQYLSYSLGTVVSIERPKDEVSQMLPLHPLSTALQADREREIRERMPKPVGVPTAHRRPAVALSVELPRHGGHAAPLAGPRVAPAGGR